MNFGWQSTPIRGRQTEDHLSTLQSCKNTLAQEIIEFMGADILKAISSRSQWKINLDAERELLACRHEVRPA